MSGTQRVYVVDQYSQHAAHYTSWISDVDGPVEMLDPVDEDWLPPADAALVVSLQHYEVPEVGILRRATLENRVPVLILADGILEYRNTWLRPDQPRGYLFQPVLGHKIACIGRSQCRILESWGNLGKCELVGAPRLDPLLDRKPRTRRPDQTCRVLVMTARKAGFTAQQMHHVRKSLIDLRMWFDEHPRFAGATIQPVWRLTENLAEEIGVPNQLRDLGGPDLSRVLERVDAAITTPSTALLEAMLERLPVALLDYSHCPQYVPAAWTISAPQHIENVLSELMDPPAAKMLYQDTMLHDALECRTPAKPRLIRLIRRMIRNGSECGQQGRPLELPRRILFDEQDAHHLPEEAFDLDQLYPEHRDTQHLQERALELELDHYRRQLGQLSQQLAALHEPYQRADQAPVCGPLIRLRRRAKKMWCVLTGKKWPGLN